MTPYALNELSKRLSVVETITHAPTSVDKKDSKMALPPHIMAKLGTGFHGATRARPFKTRVSDHFNVVSSANTALTTVSNLTPLNLQDSKTFASVFDEARVVAVELEVMTNCYVSATGAPTAPASIAHGAIVYDPANSGVYSALANTLDALYKLGPYSMGATGVGVPYLSGRQRMLIKIPPTVDPGLVTDLLGSNWVGAADTGVLVGYLKPYVETCGAAVSSHVAYFLTYHIEYAFRT